MLVEDNPGDARLFRRTVDRLGLDIDLIVAETAETALSHLRSNAADPVGGQPDLVLADINLPAMSGIDLVRLVKEDPVLRRIPCIMLSSSESAEDVRAAYDVHANGYLCKVTSIDEYERGIRVLTDYWFGLMHMAYAGSIIPRLSAEYVAEAAPSARRLAS